MFAYLQQVYSHPTADEVYQAVRGTLPRISLATVYSLLRALVEVHLATKLTSGDNSARYDCRGEDHYHLRDVATGAVDHLPASYDPDLLSKLDPKLLAKLASSGFQVTGYRLEVLGRFEKYCVLNRAVYRFRRYRLRPSIAFSSFQGRVLATSALVRPALTSLHIL